MSDVRGGNYSSDHFPVVAFVDLTSTNTNTNTNTNNS